MSKKEIQCFNYRGKMYFRKRPMFTKEVKTVYDNKLSMEIIYLVSSRPMILPLLSLLFVFFSIYFTLTNEQQSHFINVPKVMCAYNNYLDINVLNDKQNEQMIDISLFYKDIELYSKSGIKPGEFIGTVEKKINLSAGSYTCKYKYVIHGKFTKTIRYYDVLLNVK